VHDNDLELVQSLYAAFGRGDLPFILDRLAPDVEWSHPRPAEIPWGGTRHGRDAVAGFFAALAGGVDVESFEPRTFLCQDGTVVVLGREAMRVKANGRRYATDWVHAWSVRDGRVVRFQEFTDSATIVEAFRPA
jgi:hypothetical protein